MFFVESSSSKDKGLTKAPKVFGICGTSTTGSFRLRIQITWSGGSHQSFSAMGSGVLQLLGTESFLLKCFIQTGLEVNSWKSLSKLATRGGFLVFERKCTKQTFP